MPLQDFVERFSFSRVETEDEKRIQCFLQRIGPKCKWGWEVRAGCASDMEGNKFIAVDYRGTTVVYIAHSEICKDVVKALDAVEALMKDKKNG